MRGIVAQSFRHGLPHTAMNEMGKEPRGHPFRILMPISIFIGIGVAFLTQSGAIFAKIVSAEIDRSLDFTNSPKLFI